jgi:hypothetical protein
MKMYRIAAAAFMLSSNVYAQSLESGGIIEFGGTGYRTPYNGASNEPGSRGGLYGATQATVPFGDESRFVMDFQTEHFRNKSEEFSYFGPHRATLASFAIHSRMVGGLAGPFMGYAQPDVDDGKSNGRSGGYLGGLQYISDGSSQGFLTVGYADIVSDFTSSDFTNRKADGGFEGAFTEFGMVSALGTDGAIKLHGGFGRTSKAFHNNDVYASASYSSFGVKMVYAVMPNFHLVANVEHSQHRSSETSMDFSDRARDTRYSVGVVIPFGKQVITTASLRPLAPPLAVVRAAAWNEVLDNSAIGKPQ